MINQLVKLMDQLLITISEYPIFVQKFIGFIFLLLGLLGLILPVLPGWLFILPGITIIHPPLGEKLKESNTKYQFAKRGIVYIKLTKRWFKQKFYNFISAF